MPHGHDSFCLERARLQDSQVSQIAQQDNRQIINPKSQILQYSTAKAVSPLNSALSMVLPLLHILRARCFTYLIFETF